MHVRIALKISRNASNFEKQSKSITSTPKCSSDISFIDFEGIKSKIDKRIILTKNIKPNVLLFKNSVGT